MDDESLPHIAIYFIPWDLFRVDIPPVFFDSLDLAVFSSGGVSNIPLVAYSLFEAIVRWHVLVGDKFLVQSITWR